MLRREDGTSPLIPRPFSLYRQEPGVLEFIIKLMGPGTRALGALRPGEPVRLIGPLGNGWPTLSGGGPPWVMLAGGIGSAPYFLAIEQALAGMDGAPAAAPAELALVFGAATRGLLYDIDRLSALGIPVFPATDDGSTGFHGNALDCLRDLWERGVLPREVRLLACGPEPMLEAVEALAEERGLACWLSLETLMGCGVGICNGCPVDTRPDGAFDGWPNAKCCVEGPVFSTADVRLRPESAAVNQLGGCAG